LKKLKKEKLFILVMIKKGRPVQYISVKDHIKGEFPSGQTEK
jgi:hypothetical protein